MAEVSEVSRFTEAEAEMFWGREEEVGTHCSEGVVCQMMKTFWKWVVAGLYIMDVLNTPELHT